MLSNVVLPEPEWPIRATNSPRLTSMLRSVRASTVLCLTEYDFDRFSVLRTTSLVAKRLRGPQEQSPCGWIHCAKKRERNGNREA